MNVNLDGKSEHCVVCECVKPLGIHVHTNFICTECENEIIHTDTDSLKYLFFVRQLKQLSASLNR